MNTVPFTLSDVWGGFGEGAGLLHDEGNQLRLEFEIKDGVFGAIKSGVKQVVIPVRRTRHRYAYEGLAGNRMIRR